MYFLYLRRFLQFCVMPFTARLTANAHLASDADRSTTRARSRKIYREKRKEAQNERKRGIVGRNKRERRKRVTLSSGSSRFLGVQRSLYGQAIFMTKPPGRAEVTREVTRYFRHVTRRYSHSSPGKENDSLRVL